MPTLENVNKRLADLLVTRNLNPEMRDRQGKTVTSSSDADMFSFNFVPSSGRDYGTVVIFLGDDSSLQVYYGDNVGKTMESQDKDEWFQFLEQLSLYSKRNRLDFDLKNINKLRYTMQGQSALREGLFESWTGKRNVSYNDQPDAVRLMIRHNRDIREGEQRHRHIESLFLETTDGERFKLPFKSLAGGRAVCEHVRQGGKPYDVRGQHIAEMVDEIGVLGRFSRASPAVVFEDERLIEEAVAHLVALKETLRTLGTRRGYERYFETWNPAEVTAGDVMVEEVRNLLTTQDIDARIEAALPALARLASRRTAADVFEAWADDVCSETTRKPK